MTLGFSIEDGGTDPPVSDEDMATLALEQGAVNADRVLAFYAARYLIGSKATPEDITGVAQWLTGKAAPVASEVDDEEDDEDEMAPPRPTIELRDLWPPVLVSLVRWARTVL